MSDRKEVGPLFWVIGAIFLIWNAYGCYMYYSLHTMSDAAYAEMAGDAMLAVRDKVPVWGTSAFAIAVWGGLLGALMFLLQKKIALWIFIISLIAGIISFIPGFTMTEFKEAAKASGQNQIFMPAFVTIMGIIEIFVSRMKVNKGIFT